MHLGTLPRECSDASRGARARRGRAAGCVRGSRGASSCVAPSLPDSPPWVSEPGADLMVGQVEHELPEPKLPRAQACAAPLLEPGPQRFLSQQTPYPEHRPPIPRRQDPSDDQVGIGVPGQACKVVIPEKGSEPPGKPGRIPAARSVRFHTCLHDSVKRTGSVDRRLSANRGFLYRQYIPASPNRPRVRASGHVHQWTTAIPPYHRPPSARPLRCPAGR
jgi:hypothetical protein